MRADDDLGMKKKILQFWLNKLQKLKQNRQMKQQEVSTLTISCKSMAYLIHLKPYNVLKLQNNVSCVHQFFNVFTLILLFLILSLGSSTAPLLLRLLPQLLILQLRLLRLP